MTMAIERKYGRVATERGDIGEDEPVFLFRGRDELLPDVIDHYMLLCQQAGSPQHHIDGLVASKAEIVEWQATHHTQIPQSAAQAP
jgi:hypothetical protein